jgi:outer membrane receptor protein involved in Fe transport
MTQRSQRSYRDSARWQKGMHAFPNTGVRRLTVAVRAAFVEVAYRNRASKKLAGLVGAAALGLTLSAVAEPVSVDLPAQPLADSLTQLAKKAGVSLMVDSAIVSGKTAPAVRGSLEPDEAFRRLLRGSGLQYTKEGDTALIRRQPVNTSKNDTIRTDAVEVTASRFKQVGPMPGLALTKEEIPGNVQTITAEEIKASKAMTIAELFNSRLQSVNVNDYQGNSFQMDITYRGFTAGPQIGMPQGLSVFFDGVRVNEPFGDVVNWDLIPMNTLASIDVFPGSNPVFGLNTLGGAVAMRTKNGFDDPGTEAQVLTGSFGRKQVMLSTGDNNGRVGGFLAFNRFEEDGWRDNSPSKVMQAFGKASVRTDNLDLHGSVTYVRNDLVGNGLIPIEMYNEDPESVFTSPDQTKNELLQFQISGAFQVNDTMSITGQVYRRKSDRQAVTGDVNRDFGDREFGRNRYATRRPKEGEKLVCAFASTNPYGIPDYYLAPSIFSGFPLTLLNALDYEAGNTSYDLDGDGDYDLADAIADGSLDPSTLNQPLDAEAAFLAAARNYEQYMFNGEEGGSPNQPQYINDTPNGNFENTSQYLGLLSGGAVGSWFTTLTNTTQNYFTDINDPSQTMAYVLIAAEPLNGPDCGENATLGSDVEFVGGQLRVLDENGRQITRNGAWDTFTQGAGTGYVDGTPNAIISSVDIGQIIRGGSMQFNWDSGRHKFMLGTSLDLSSTKYTNSQILGLLNADRKAYVAPEEIGAEFAGATYPVRNNDFNGSSKTRSAYVSETFTPVERFHFTASARYNHTRVMTNMRTRRNTEEISLSQGENLFMEYLLCKGANLSDCNQYLLNNPVAYPDTLPGGSYGGVFDYYDPWEKEVATYNKINPAFGASWSPHDYLNIYGNWSQGTRTPSAIELGCAFDSTPVKLENNGVVYYRPRSLVNGRSCTLPTALSGDPYLPQVVARTLEFGGRGKLANGWDWNASIYNTNLQDDIYFVAYTATQSFFDTIGKTRRRGLEMGLGGKEGKWDFRANYSLTDATFEATARIANADNSSVNHVSNQSTDYNIMTIEPGDRMPGIPLHNLNLNLGYNVTDKWRVGLTMVAHSSSYARGNENNEHRGNTFQEVVVTDNNGGTTTVRRNFKGDGKTPGYAVFNLNTTYDFGNGWIANLTVNNLLDKDYYSASRLDINPFSPSINGAIGPSGFNYNSNEWQSTTFVAPGAPRAAWFTLKYEFGADNRK